MIVQATVIYYIDIDYDILNTVLLFVNYNYQHALNVFREKVTNVPPTVLIALHFTRQRSLWVPVKIEN